MIEKKVGVSKCTSTFIFGVPNLYDDTRSFLYLYTPMHEVTPKVVAMAVRIVMAMCRIFCQSSFLFIFLELRIES